MSGTEPGWRLGDIMDHLERDSGRLLVQSGARITARMVHIVFVPPPPSPQRPTPHLTRIFLLKKQGSR